MDTRQLNEIIEDSRQDFEAECKRDCINLRLSNTPGIYAFYHAQTLWDGWKMHITHIATECP